MSVSASIQRRVQWMDTDAAGIWHHSTVIRWVEEAEAEMNRNLGISDVMFGATPRVRTEFDFGASLRFDDEVQIDLEVAALGRTSITYQARVTFGETEVASGRMVAVLIDRETGKKREWPPELREVLDPGSTSGATS